MSRTFRRLVPIALLLALALILAAPAQARENPAAGWLGAWAQHFAQWTAGWFAAPVQPKSRPLPNKPRPPATVDCGPEVDPNGACKRAIAMRPLGSGTVS